MYFMGEKTGMSRANPTGPRGTVRWEGIVLIVVAVLYRGAGAGQTPSPAKATPIKAVTSQPKVAPKPISNMPAPKPKISPATWTRETPFGDAIDALRNATEPPLNIIVLWRQIGDNADIFRETPIGFDSIPGLRLGQYLDTLLLSVSAGGIAKLGYVVDGGAIIITTTDALPVPKRVPRVYDVTDLVGALRMRPAPV